MATKRLDVGLVECPHCPAKVRSDRLGRHVVGVHPDVGLVACPHCCAKIRPDRLPRHVAKVHSTDGPVPPKRRLRLPISNIRNARKHHEADGFWTLATRGGVVIGRFTTEAELDSWWQNLLAGRMREATGVNQGKRARSRGAGKTSRATGAGSDYLKPWSSRYNMPEYDLE